MRVTLSIPLMVATRYQAIKNIEEKNPTQIFDGIPCSGSEISKAYEALKSIMEQ
jgi:hypothetical protein